MDAQLLAAVDALSNPSTDPSEHENHFSVVLQHVPARTSFASLLRQVGDYLTNADANVRRLCTGLLADILSRAHNLGLEASEATHMCSFFCSRLGDYPSVGPCLRALTALLRRHGHAVDGRCAPAIADAVFKEVHVPAMEQKLRQAVFDMFALMLDTPAYREALASSAANFAAGFVTAMEGEKDPRCLLVCLRLACSVLESFGPKIEDLVEDVFDVTSVYFPITFTPPPNDPYGITQEDLVAALLSVFRASPAMAEHVVPLALEKLSSSLTNAKMDALEVVRACAPHYGVERMAPFFTSLGIAIRAEVVDSEDADIVAQALRAVTELSALASSVWENTGSRTAWDQFVSPLLDTALQQIRESSATLHGRASCKLLSAVAKASPHAFKHVAAAGMELLKRGARSEYAAQRQVSVTTLVSLLQAIDPKLAYPKGQHPLCEYLDDTLELLRHILHRGAKMLPRGSKVKCSNDSTPVTQARCEAAMGLALMAGTVSPHPLLALDVVQTIVTDLTNVLGYDSDCQVRSAALRALATLAGGRDEYADEILDRTVPMLLEGVPMPDGEAADVTEEVSHPREAPHATVGEDGEALPTSGAGAGAGAGGAGGDGGDGDSAAVGSSGLPAERALCLKQSLRSITALCRVPALFKEVVPQLMRRAVANRPALMKHAVVLSDYWGGKVATEVLRALADIVVANKDSVESMDSCIGVRVPGPGCTPCAAAVTGDDKTDLLAGCNPCSLRLIPTLLNVVVHAASTPAVQAGVMSPCDQGFSFIGTIFRTVARHASEERQDILRRGIVALFLGRSEPAKACEKVLCFRMVPHFRPLLPSAVSRQFHTLVLLADVLGSGRRGAPLPQFTDLCAALLSLITTLCGLDNGSPARSAKPNAGTAPEVVARYGGDMGAVAERTAPSESLHERLSAEATACKQAAKVLAVLLNRQPRGEQMNVALNAVTTTFDNLLSHAAADLAPIHACSAVEAFVWACKGLAVRWFAGFDVMLRKLCAIVAPAEGSRLAANKTLLQCAATGFGALVKEDWIFARTCGANVSILYRQRTFAVCFPLLTTPPPGQRRPHHWQLLALCSLVPEMPPALVIQEMSTLLPLILVSLQSSELAPAALTTFEMLVRLAVDSVSPHLGSVTPLLIKLSKPKKRNAPIVRARAIDCLRCLTALPYHKLHPYKDAVVRGLTAALDDPKRPVRRRAVCCRNDWMTLS